MNVLHARFPPSVYTYKRNDNSVVIELPKMDEPISITDLDDQMPGGTEIFTSTVMASPKSSIPVIEVMFPPADSVEETVYESSAVSKRDAESGGKKRKKSWCRFYGIPMGVAYGVLLLAYFQPGRMLIERALESVLWGAGS